MHSHRHNQLVVQRGMNVRVLRHTNSALSHRLAARRGRKRAVIAVAHNLLVIAYYILRDGTCYRDLGPDYFDRLNPERLRRQLTKRLERLGFKVNLEPLPQVA
jgi:transposase